ncbi:hypothetical protein HOLleu_36870 [Holothuria leucospilota]|uniref:Serine-threonine/tyrosine-protein kinase catalytic domain-containing protein n=1 Tax=Holothuria leucospilota TaxID=206669 RepID=A0A9Q0YP97_HOLLE|nr:hypothetical protein HOLleu_36870 [Holothuria leucospilota]
MANVSFYLNGSGPTDFSASLQLALRDRPVNGVSNISRDLPSIRRSMDTSPDEDTVDMYAEEDKTSTVTNVELGIHLPGDGTFQYWTANASFKNENSKKIIAKCVSGEIPYSGLTCEEIEQEIRKMRYLDQPLTCPGGIFSMMLASWDTTVDERPDLSEWKQKLVCLLQSARQDLDDKTSTDGTGDQSYFTLENNICDYEDGYIEQ